MQKKKCGSPVFLAYCRITRSTAKPNEAPSTTSTHRPGEEYRKISKSIHRSWKSVQTLMRTWVRRYAIGETNLHASSSNNTNISLSTLNTRHHIQTYYTRRNKQKKKTSIPSRIWRGIGRVICRLFKMCGALVCVFNGHGRLKLIASAKWNQQHWWWNYRNASTYKKYTPLSSNNHTHRAFGLKSNSDPKGTIQLGDTQWNTSFVKLDFVIFWSQPQNIRNNRLKTHTHTQQQTEKKKQQNQLQIFCSTDTELVRLSFLKIFIW